MYEIRAKTNARDYIDALSDLQRQQLPFAIVVALTRTAWLAKTAEHGPNHPCTAHRFLAERASVRSVR